MVRNVLADPYLLGVTSGASTGAAATILFGVGAGTGAGSLTGSAFVGAAIATGTVFLLARVGGRVTSIRLLLAGVAIGYILAATTSFLIFVSDSPEGARAVLFWLLGSLSLAQWSSITFAGPIVVASLIMLIVWARRFDALAIGDDTPQTLGVPPARLRAQAVVVVALCVGSVVAFFGRHRLRRADRPPRRAAVRRRRAPARLSTTCLAADEILVFDNYRCPHGARAHEGTRMTNVLRSSPTTRAERAGSATSHAAARDSLPRRARPRRRPPPGSSREADVMPNTTTDPDWSALLEGWDRQQEIYVPDRDELIGRMLDVTEAVRRCGAAGARPRMWSGRDQRAAAAPVPGSPHRRRRPQPGADGDGSGHAG